MQHATKTPYFSDYIQQYAKYVYIINIAKCYTVSAALINPQASV